MVLRIRTTTVDDILNEFLLVLTTRYIVSDSLKVQQHRWLIAHHEGKFSTHVVFPDFWLARPGQMCNLMTEVMTSLTKVRAKLCDATRYSDSALKEFRLPYKYRYVPHYSKTQIGGNYLTFHAYFFSQFSNQLSSRN